MRRLIMMCLAMGGCAAAQSQPSGVPEQWDVRQLVASLDAQAKRLNPMMAQINTGQWTANGAPAAYVSQWKTAESQLRYFFDSCAALAKQPDRLTLALDTYIRMQALESTLRVTLEAIRKYQSPALGDQLQAAIAENNNNRDRLRQYVQDLAAEKEQEFQVADREAQRCRGSIAQQPAPAAPKSKRTEQK